MIAVVVLIALFGYLAIGAGLAYEDWPNAWERAQKAYELPEGQVMSVSNQSCMMFFFWPVVLPFRSICYIVAGLRREREIDTLEEVWNLPDATFCNN